MISEVISCGTALKWTQVLAELAILELWKS